MKTKSCTLKSLLAGTLLFLAGCRPPDGQSLQPESGTSASVSNIQVAVSAFCPNPERAQLAGFVQQFIKTAGTNAQLEFFDGTSTHQIARLKIPPLEFDSARARAKALGPALVSAAQFLKTNETQVVLEPTINLPGLLRTLPVTGASNANVILVVGSPWQTPRGDAGFSMLPDHRLPTDDHLLETPAESPYGLGGFTNRLNGARVVFAALGDSPSDRADEALRLFWAKAIGLAGGSLILCTRDVNRALEVTLNPGALADVPPTPPLALAGGLMMKSAADYVTFANRVAIVRIGGDGPVNDRVEPPGLQVEPQHPETDWQRRESLRVAEPVLTTNRTVVANEIVRTNWFVATNFVRLPEVHSEIVTNLVTNWVFSARLRTNPVVTTNTVFATNVVVSTNFVLSSSFQTRAKP